jgi:hypothetical protein
MTKLVNVFAIAAMFLLGALPAGAAELLTSPRVVRTSTAHYGYPFMGWRPSFEFTTGYHYYHEGPNFVGPVPACGVITEPFVRKGETYYRQVYRCW